MMPKCARERGVNVGYAVSNISFPLGRVIANPCKDHRRVRPEIDRTVKREDIEHRFLKSAHEMSGEEFEPGDRYLLDWGYFCFRDYEHN